MTNTMAKFFRICKDGGPESNVSGLFIIESKRLFSIVLLRFADGSREAYHNHAFNAVSWLLRGKLVEYPIEGGRTAHRPSLKPIITPRKMFHMVRSDGVSWVLSFRGPWRSWWNEM